MAKYSEGLINEKWEGQEAKHNIKNKDASSHAITSAQHLPNQSSFKKKEFVSAFYVSTLSTNEKSLHRAAAGRI